MEIEKAFKRLLIKNPFYGLFCLSLPKEITRKTDTLCVSVHGTGCKLNINPDFWEQHTDDEQIALLTHELSHIALQHMFISKSFDNAFLFNMAADCEVNSYIENLPKDGITAKSVSAKMNLTPFLENGLGTKRYYEEIQKYLQQQQQAQAQNPQKPCNGGQGGSGSNSQECNCNSNPDSESSSNSSSPSEATPDNLQQNNNPQENNQQPPSPQEQSEKPENQQQPDDDQDEPQDPQKQQQRQQERGDEDDYQDMSEQYPEGFKEFNPIDDHSTWKDFQSIPEVRKQLIANNINAILKNTAEQVEKMHGTIPGELSTVIEKLRKKRPEVFNWKAYFRRMLGSIYDVNIRSTRRKPSKRFVDSAGIQHRKKVSILVAVDTSGSVSDKELKEFFSEIDYAYKSGAKVTIMQCDTRINSVEEYDDKNIPEIKGRGGTDFNPPVDYYYKHRKEYASLIYFTDGEAPLPNRNPTGMVWVISSMGMHQEYPGKVIYIPKEQKQ